MSYIKAELFRFTKKRSLKLLLAIFTIGYSIAVFQFDGSGNSVTAFTTMLIQMSPVLIGIATFIMVYTDDITAHSTQISIGYGYSRIQIVLFKLIEMMLMTVLIMAYCFSLATALSFIFKFDLNYSELFKFAGVSLLQTFYLSTVASIFAFGFQKTSIAIITFVVLTTNIIDTLIKLILQWEPVAKLLPNVVSYLPDTLLFEMFYSGIQFKNIALIILYGSIATIISIYLFNKTEMEF